MNHPPLITPLYSILPYTIAEKERGKARLIATVDVPPSQREHVNVQNNLVVIPSSWSLEMGLNVAHRFSQSRE